MTEPSIHGRLRFGEKGLLFHLHDGVSIVVNAKGHICLSCAETVEIMDFDLNIQPKVLDVPENDRETKLDCMDGCIQLYRKTSGVWELVAEIWRGL